MHCSQIILQTGYKEKTQAYWQKKKKKQNGNQRGKKIAGINFYYPRVNGDSESNTLEESFFLNIQFIFIVSSPKNVINVTGWKYSFK